MPGTVHKAHRSSSVNNGHIPECVALQTFVELLSKRLENDEGQTQMRSMVVHVEKSLL